MHTVLVTDSFSSHILHTGDIHHSLSRSESVGEDNYNGRPRFLGDLHRDHYSSDV